MRSPRCASAGRSTSWPQGRTTIAIAHRLSTAARADRVLVLDHGRLVEDGSHAELLAAGGAYSRMYDVVDRGDGLDPVDHGSCSTSNGRRTEHVGDLALDRSLVELGTDADHGTVSSAPTSLTATVSDAARLVGAGELDDDAVVVRHGRRGCGWCRSSVARPFSRMHGCVDEAARAARLDVVAKLAHDRPGEEEASDTHGQRDRRQHQAGHREASAVAVVPTGCLEPENAEHDGDDRRAGGEDEHERHPADATPRCR